MVRGSHRKAVIGRLHLSAYHLRRRQFQDQHLGLPLQSLTRPLLTGIKNLCLSFR